MIKSNGEQKPAMKYADSTPPSKKNIAALSLSKTKSESDIFAAKNIFPSENGQDVLDTLEALLGSAMSHSSTNNSKNPTEYQFLISSDEEYDESILPSFGFKNGVVIQQPEHGVVTRYADGTFSYVPHDGFVGDDVSKYTESDGNHVSTESITVSVLYPNHSPEENDVLLPESGQVMFRFSPDHLLVNDIDRNLQYRFLSFPQVHQESNY